MAREPLTVERIIAGTVAVADRGGLAAVSMRNVGKELGVEAMSLYHHVADKDTLLDALIEWVFAQVELPRPDDDWRRGMERRASSLRQVLTRHPWALSLVDSRPSPGPAQLSNLDAVIGCLRRGGFSAALTARAFAVIDAYVFGFVLTEQNLPFDSAGEGASDLATEMSGLLAPYPHLAEFVAEIATAPDYTFAAEFGHGLAIILDRLAALRGQEPIG